MADGKADGQTIAQAVEKFGKKYPEGNLLCVDKDLVADKMGSPKEIEKKLKEAGINNVAVEDVKGKSGKDMTCIAIGHSKKKKGRK